MLAEATTAEFSRREDPEGFSESLDVARRGGHGAGAAREKIESDLGESVLSSNNYLEKKEGRKKLSEVE